jgi:hypothetical protein
LLPEVNATSTASRPRVTPVIVGYAGRAAATKLPDAAEYGLAPIPLIASALHVYVRAFVSDDEEN